MSGQAQAEREVAYLFRKQAPRAVSIERVFEDVIAHLPPGFRARRVYCEHATGILPRVSNILRAWRMRGQINHITGEVYYLALGLSKRSTIITIHDCRYEHERNRLKRALLMLLWFALPVRRAAAITVISEATRDDLVRLTGIDKERVLVIPNPTPSDLHYAPREFRSERPRILHLGTAPNKNLARVIESLKGLDVLLDVVGPETDAFVHLAKAAGVRAQFSEYLTRDAVREKYAAADLVSFPSTYEGFGLPILEAQAVGRPVLTSDRSPMREVAGGGACLVDPFDAAAIRTGFERLIKDNAYRQELIRRGSLNCMKYDAAVIARQYARLYDTLPR